MASSSHFRFQNKMNYDFHPTARGPVNLETALMGIEQADLIRRIPEEEVAFLFKHALVQDTAYSSLLKQERKHFHRDVAETLERLYGVRLDDFAALLTQHFAEAGDDAKTIEYAIRAGDAAARLSAPTEARTHYAHALEALARLPDNDENARLRMNTLSRQVHVSRFADSPARNLERLDEAEVIAKRLSGAFPDVQHQLAEIYHWKGFVNLIRNQNRLALAGFNESRALAQELGDYYLVATNLVHAGAVFNFQGRFGEAEPLLLESIHLMSRGEIPVEGLFAIAQLGLSRANQGFYTEGLAHARRALTMAQQANHVGGIEVCYSILVQIYRLGGDFMQMLDASQLVVETARAVQDIVLVCSGTFSIAWAHSYLGEHYVALEQVAKARGIVDVLKGNVTSRELYAAAEAEIALNAGQVNKAQALAEKAVSLARGAENIFAEGLAQGVRAQAVAQIEPHAWETVETDLAASLALFEQGNARLEAARTHRVWGRLLQSRGDHDAGRQHLEAAAAQFQASGLHSLHDSLDS